MMVSYMINDDEKSLARILLGIIHFSCFCYCCCCISIDIVSFFHWSEHTLPKLFECNEMKKRIQAKKQPAKSLNNIICHGLHWWTQPHSKYQSNMCQAKSYISIAAMILKTLASLSILMMTTIMTIPASLLTTIHQKLPTMKRTTMTIRLKLWRTMMTCLYIQCFPFDRCKFMFIALVLYPKYFGCCCHSNCLVLDKYCFEIWHHSWSFIFVWFAADTPMPCYSSRFKFHNIHGIFCWFCWCLYNACFQKCIIEASILHQVGIMLWNKLEEW